MSNPFLFFLGLSPVTLHLPIPMSVLTLIFPQQSLAVTSQLLPPLFLKHYLAVSDWLLDTSIWIPSSC